MVRQIGAREALRQRLSSAARSVEGAYAVYVDEIETRDRIVLEAIDAGISRGDVAEWAGVKPARVTQIVAKEARRG